jgi:hypothetical protein
LGREVTVEERELALADDDVLSVETTGSVTRGQERALGRADHL